MKIFSGIKKQYTILIIIVMGIILAVYFLFIFQPLLRKFMILNAEERTCRDQLAKARTVIADKNKIFNDVNNIVEKIKYYERRLPRNADISQVLEELIKMGQKSNVSFISIEPQSIQKIEIDPKIGATYLEIPIKLKLKGGYHEIAKFVNNIENSQRFMKVDYIKIVSSGENIKIHDIDLVVSAFALEDKKEVRKDNEK